MTSSLAWIRRRLDETAETEAVVEAGRSFTYTELAVAVDETRDRLRGWGLGPGECVAFAGDFSLVNVARFIALLLEKMVAIPVTTRTFLQEEGLVTASPAHWFFPRGAAADVPPLVRGASEHPLLTELRDRGVPGLIIMTSGSTGSPKVILHDASRLLDKFRYPRRAYRVLAFLLADHMGGVNTLFGGLTSGGTIIVPDGRNPEAVCRLIERTRATLVPVTPSFLNLLLLSDAWRRHDLSSVQVISYGTEVMPEATLTAAVKALPGVRFAQLYGSSELGIFRGRSKASHSPLVKLVGADFEIREGRLWVRGADSMLGYLSGQPSGFGEDGWYDTGDAVVTDGEYIRFLGRTSDLINVGGLKVFPAEVERAVTALDGVLECSAWGEDNVLSGQVVVAKVQLSTGESAATFKRRMRAALRDVLEPYKIPVKITVADGLMSERFKKIRGNR